MHSSASRRPQVPGAQSPTPHKSNGGVCLAAPWKQKQEDQKLSATFSYAANCVVNLGYPNEILSQNPKATKQRFGL